MTFNAADRVGVVGGYIGGISSLLGMLGNGNGLNLTGGNCGCSDNVAVNRYEMGLQKDLTNKDMEIAYLRSRDAAKTDSLEVYRYIDGKIACVERELADQRTYNAVNTANINCLSGQVAEMLSLSKRVIGNSNICPGWGDVTVSVTPTTTTSAG